MGFGFNLLFVFVLLPLLVILLIILLLFWAFSKKKIIFGKILGFVGLGIVALYLVSYTLHALAGKKVLKQKDYYGQYIIDRDFFRVKMLTGNMIISGLRSERTTKSISTLRTGTK